ncbi:Meckelin isoform X4 [Oopsacas minuta]|uniref:Meckelin isoform X4 n=1 Tax=Oopsacas minuta TaxID=111878 RepID=A0AAV7KB47_9METZ|nr:Meckelin isoform X4 [Oopsacas minuta]
MSGNCPPNHYFYPANISCISCSSVNLSVNCGIPDLNICTGITTPAINCDNCATKAQRCIEIANECLLGELDSHDCSDFSPVDLQYEDVIDYLDDNPITQDFFVTGPNAEVIPIIFARFLRDGQFIGLSNNWNHFSPCTDRDSSFQIGTLVGTNYFISCRFVNPNSELVFIEAYILQSNSLIQLPFYVRLANGKTLHRRRIYQFQPSSGDFINEIQLNMTFDPNTKRILTPSLFVSYAHNTTTQLQSMSISYSQDHTGINIALPLIILILFIFSLVWVGIQINGWMRKSGRTFCDPVTFCVLFILSANYLSIIIFVITLITSSILFLFYKCQSKLFFLIPQQYQETLLILLITFAVVLQAIHVIYVLFLQCTTDVFIIDWERARTMNQEKVSIWRSYLIVNEWLKLQTMRKINLAALLIILLVLLEAIELINITSSQPLTIVMSTDLYLAPTSRYMRLAISSILFLLIALVQFMCNFLYERFVGHKLNQFVDLCSVSNISFIALNFPRFGYYIHGRSVHGVADTDLRTLTKFLSKEEEDIVGKRGLDGTSDQVFEISITCDMRQEYDKIMRHMNLSRGSEGKNQNPNSLQETDLVAHQLLTKLFTSFVEKSHKSFRFEKREKLLCERVTSIELYEPIEVSFMYPDDSNTFSHLIFWGFESTLLLFNLLTYQFCDMITRNSIAACFITYITDVLLVWIRRVWSKHNIANKTLLDKRFFN